MGTLYIDRKGLTVKLDGNALVFYSVSGREGMVPINPLKRVVVVGSVTIESSALNRLCDENIGVVFLSGRNMRFHGMLQGKLHNNGALRLKQYEKSLSAFPARYAHALVSRKIASQEALLKDALDRRADVRFPITTALGTLARITATLEEHGKVLHSSGEYVSHGFLDSLRGYEGSAAAAYFAAFTSLFPPSLTFTGRNRRPPEDPVNAMLSLCYTLLHFDAVREIEMIGLDPTIGFYHQFEYGRESLASDIMEPLRPDADRFVWELFRERTFTVRDFAFNTERLGCYLKKGSRKRFYPLHDEWRRTIRPGLTDAVRSLAREITGRDDDDVWDVAESDGDYDE